MITGLHGMSDFIMTAQSSNLSNRCHFEPISKLFVYFLNRNRKSWEICRRKNLIKKNNVFQKLIIYLQSWYQRWLLKALSFFLLCSTLVDRLSSIKNSKASNIRIPFRLSLPIQCQCHVFSYKCIFYSGFWVHQHVHMTSLPVVHHLSSWKPSFCQKTKNYFGLQHSI